MAPLGEGDRQVSDTCSVGYLRVDKFSFLLAAMVDRTYLDGLEVMVPIPNQVEMFSIQY